MRKSRTRQRREAAPAIDKIARPSPPPANRGTFRVAQALRQAAAELPGVVRNRQAERRAAASPRRTPAPLSPLPTVAQGEAQRSPRQEAKRNAPAQPSLRDAPKSGVCRPRGGPKSGGGAGREFVPFKDCK